MRAARPALAREVLARQLPRPLHAPAERPAVTAAVLYVRDRWLERRAFELRRGSPGSRQIERAPTNGRPRPLQ